MKNRRTHSSAGAEQAIQQVLQAERDAEQAIRDCENEVQRLLREAQSEAQRLNSRTDQRITNLEMRHGHKLDRMIRDIEKAGREVLRDEAGQNYDTDSLQSVIDSMAADLCRADPAADE